MRDTSKFSDAIHADLLASVFATLMPALVMSVLFAGVGAVVVTLGSTDPVLRGLYILGLAVTTVRVAVMLRYRARFRLPQPIAAEARALERRFGLAYLGFALVLGLFAARAIMVTAGRMDALVAVLAVGYAAGVSSSAAFRPWISVPSMMLGVVPLILAVAAIGDVGHGTLAIMLSGFLAGGIRSTLVRYRYAVDELGIRHMFAKLARSDPLTGLPNRLGLSEHLAGVARGGADVVVFCIDLDDFKPVNDRYGHPVGDVVLRAAAGRIADLLGPDDLGARIGGDEFVIVRTLDDDRSGMEALSLRISLVMSEPYPVDGAFVSVGASVGWTMFEPSDDPETVLARADQALYRAKRNRPHLDASTPAASPDRLPVRRRRAPTF